METKVATEPNATGDVGPGEYNEHLHKSLQKDVEVKVGMMSKQNPGFGIAGPAHKLPHEQEVEDDKELPGPGKYETNISQVKGDGHASSFKMPTERKKGKGFIEEAAAVEKKSAKSKKAKPKSVAVVKMSGTIAAPSGSALGDNNKINLSKYEKQLETAFRTPNHAAVAIEMHHERV